MHHRHSLLALLLLAACSGSNPSADASAATPPAASAPPTATPTPAAVEVGPDGPADIALPDGFAAATGDDAVEKGAAIFQAKGCGGCHKFEEKLVGPALKGLGERRTDAWLAKMILHPDEMTKKDPVAKDLFRSTMTQMPNQGVTADEIGALIAYIKSDGKEQ